MDFIRFSSVQRYGTHVPLQQLAFKVTVYRAFLIEEESPEVLCEVTVPWSGKLPSPQERLTMYQQLEAAVSAAAPPTVAPPAEATTGLTSSPGVGAGATSPSDAPAATASPPSATATGLPSSMRNSALLPTVEQIVAQLASPSAQLFTRPPTEDFIDEEEEDFPVDPPQGPSLLAPIVLRQHRRNHQPNNNMYIMWATGTLNGVPVAAQESLSQVQGGNAQDGVADTTTTAPPRRATSTSTSALVAMVASGGPCSIAGLEWTGEERVLCRITAERSENFFTAKPSLNEPHTILVDAVHIYSFVIRAVDVATLNEGQDREMVAESLKTSQRSGLAAVAPFLPGAQLVSATAATLAAAEQATEIIRTLSVQASEGLDGLQLSSPTTSDSAATTGGCRTDTAAAAARRKSGSRIGAVGIHDKAQQAQRMLKDAAMAIPDNRAAANARASDRLVAAAAAGTFSVSDRDFFGAGSSTTATATTLKGAAGPAFNGATTRTTIPSTIGEGQRCRYFVYGTVDRCLGLPYDTLYLKCVLQQDTAVEERGAARGLPQFFLEQEALSQHADVVGLWSTTYPASGPGGGPASALPPTPSGQRRPLVFATQLAYAGAVTVEDYLVEVDHVFNIPFEHTYVDDALPKAPLRLAVAAFTEGIAADGHQAPVGYCSVSLPTLIPGTHKLECPMWAPHMTGKEYVKAAVAGGAPGLVDVRDSGPPLKNRTGVSVKQGLLADSEGLLCLTVNVLQQWEGD